MKLFNDKTEPVKVSTKLKKLRNQEFEQEQIFDIKIDYYTKCNTSIKVKALNKQHALEKAENDFNRHNARWISEGGNPKELIRLEIIEK